MLFFNGFLVLTISLKLHINEILLIKLISCTCMHMYYVQVSINYNHPPPQKKSSLLSTFNPKNPTKDLINKLHFSYTFLDIDQRPYQQITFL